MVIGGRYRCVSCMQELAGENAECSCGYHEGSHKSPVHCLQEGTILWNRYVIGRVIGEGGFGITYVGWDCKHNIKVAIKEFFLNGFSTRNALKSPEIKATTGEGVECFAAQREKFFKEAQVLAAFLDEPGIVNVYKFFRENNTAYIVMEFVEGVTLKDYLGKEGKISLDETLGILGPIMNSLGRVHEYNLIHRDISPDNIMITSDGRGKLIDFGAARDVSGGHKSLSVVLKHGYAPIEQYQSRGDQGPWTDVYALSATLYRCITGKVPPDAVNRLSGEEIIPVNQLEPSCIPEVASVIMNGLGLYKGDRYDSVKALKYAIITALNMNSATANEDAVNALKSENLKASDRKRYGKAADTNIVLLSVLAGVSGLLTIITSFFGAIALLFLAICVGCIIAIIVIKSRKASNNGLSAIQTGDIIECGNYNGSISWVVLNRIDNRVLVVSNDVLVTLPYDNNGPQANWPTSYLRDWLNTDFLTYSFNDNEKSNICPVYNEAGMVDYLFLLSLEEFKAYIEPRSMPNMRYEQPVWWWLRTSSHNDGKADFISERGYIKDYGYTVNDEHGGVRPAMWINI